MEGNAKNSLIYITSTSMRAMAMLCITGPVIQTFINSCGLGSKFNYLYMSLFQFTQLLTILAFSGFADGRNIFKKSALTSIVIGVSIIFYIPLCIKAQSGAAMMVLITLGVLQALGIGLFTVCEYKLPYYIFTSKQYGVAMASSGTIGSVLTMLTGMIITFFTVTFAYKTAMIYIFMALSLCMMASGWVILLFRPIESAPKEENGGSKVAMVQVLKKPIFYKFVIPNLIRGFAGGTAGVFAILALQLGFGEKTATALVTVQTVATFAGNFVFGFFSTKVSMRWLILLSSMTFLLLPLMFINSSWVYILVVAVVICGKIVSDYAVPVALFKIVPAEIAGHYNALRMTIHTLGSVLATSAATVISPVALVILTLLFQMMFAVSYFMFKEIKNA